MAENIIHFGGIRLRVVGSGNLRPTMYSFDKIKSSVLVPLVMNSTDNIEPTRISNFVSQRMMLRLETTAINEIMRINRIIIFAKPIYTSYPG